MISRLHRKRCGLRCNLPDYHFGRLPWLKTVFSYDFGGTTHEATLNHRDPLKVMQDKLMDPIHNPVTDMWWEHDIGDDWTKQRFSDFNHSVPGWLMEGFLPPGQRIMRFSIGSDGSCLDALQKRSAHPVNMRLDAFYMGTRRQLSSSLTLAYLPNVEGGAEEKRAMFGAAIELICRGLNHAGRYGVDMEIRRGERAEQVGDAPHTGTRSRCVCAQAADIRRRGPASIRS